MAETMLDTTGLDKRDAYRQVRAQLASLLEGERDEVAAMATISCVLHHAFRRLWTGFYRVVSPGVLAVGPYQGTLGCLRIEFGKGVCGVAAARGTTQVVADVHAFAGHIACDARSASEIVVPVRNASGRIIAVLDIDSDKPATFDDTDRVELEAVVAGFIHGWGLPPGDSLVGVTVRRSP